MRFVFKAPPADQIPSDEDLQRLLEIIRTFSKRLEKRLDDGTSVDEWRREFESLLRMGHEEAYGLGFRRSRGIAPSAEMAKLVAEEVLQHERQFIDGFEADLRNWAVLFPARRMAMYAGRMRGTANGGWLDGLSGEDLITWHLGIGDHCEDCPRIARGSPYTKANLPAIPGGNQTPCLFNCLCWLSVGEETGFQRVEIWSPPETWVEGALDDGDGLVKARAVLSTEGFDEVTAKLYRGDFTVSWGENPEAARQLIRRTFGRDVSRVELARLVAVPAGSEVIVSEYMGELLVQAKQRVLRMTMARVFRVIDGEVVPYQWVLNVLTKGNRTGTRIAALQLKNYAAFGFRRATMWAAGEPGGESNGFYTWPNMGYKMIFTQEQREEIEEAGFDAADTHELFMRYPEETTRPGELSGKAWWKLNGSKGDAVFDLRHTSAHWRLLRRHLAHLDIRI